MAHSQVTKDMTLDRRIWMTRIRVEGQLDKSVVVYTLAIVQ